MPKEPRSGRRQRERTAMPAAHVPSRAQTAEIKPPSVTARVTGAVIAAITVVIGVMMFVEAGDATGAEVVLRVVAGAVLVLLGVLVSVLSLASPWVIRRFAK